MTLPAADVVLDLTVEAKSCTTRPRGTLAEKSPLRGIGTPR